MVESMDTLKHYTIVLSYGFSCNILGKCKHFIVIIFFCLAQLLLDPVLSISTHSLEIFMKIYKKYKNEKSIAVSKIVPCSNILNTPK